MSYDGELVSLTEAQRTYDSLPAAARIPTLSPDYVAADARRDPALCPLFFVWQQGSAVFMHSLHEAEIPGQEARDWQSAYGYGGPVGAHLEEQTLTQAWEALGAAARSRSVVAEFVRFHPVLGNQTLYQGTVRADRPVVRIELVDDLMSGYTGRARTAIRKALKQGLESRWLSNTEAKVLFPEFYRQGMRQIGASDFYLFNDDYFEALLDLPGARVSMVLGAGLPLSMGLFLFGPVTVEYHLSATTGDGRAAGATSLLVHAAAQLAQQDGATGLFLGGGTDARADNPLLLFKSSFAPPQLTFCTGSHIYQPDLYGQLRAAWPERASSGRVLFYRG